MGELQAVREPLALMASGWALALPVAAALVGLAMGVRSLVAFRRESAR